MRLEETTLCLLSILPRDACLSSVVEVASPVECSIDFPCPILTLWLQTGIFPRIFHIMCKFSERIDDCGHCQKSCDSCAEVKKIGTVCTFGDKT